MNSELQTKRNNIYIYTKCFYKNRRKISNIPSCYSHNFFPEIPEHSLSTYTFYKLSRLSKQLGLIFIKREISTNTNARRKTRATARKCAKATYEQQQSDLKWLLSGR